MSEYRYEHNFLHLKN